MKQPMKHTIKHTHKHTQTWYEHTWGAILLETGIKGKKWERLEMTGKMRKKLGLQACTVGSKKQAKGT